ncbi:MAG TPA: CPBP family intramembrane glutamic endopeptidase [Chthoniobacterales bacterium]|nr:CPBP family intramembrane glutamic endopeptidase [Chthoniobacterales bacterium]
MVAAAAQVKTLRNIFGNAWVLLGLAAFGVSLAILWRNPSFGREDAIGGIIIFGIAFPLLAWVTTLRARPLVVTARRSSAEMWVLFACLVGVVFYLIWGAAFSEALVPADWLASERGKFLVVLGRKLIVFVFIPFGLFRFLFGYRWRDFGLQVAGLRALGGNHLLVVVVLSALIVLFQYFAGTAAAPIRHGEFHTGQLALGLPLCFAWLFFEVGLVEEFFFRALLQTRLAVWFKSEISGVALMALLFGLAHAPGFILRRAGLSEAIGENPSVLDAVAYAIVVLSISGIFFGIVWARTRNLIALMFIHAAADLLPNLKQFISSWGI